MHNRASIVHVIVHSLRCRHLKMPIDCRVSMRVFYCPYLLRVLNLYGMHYLEIVPASMQVVYWIIVVTTLFKRSILRVCLIVKDLPPMRVLRARVQTTPHICSLNNYSILIPCRLLMIKVALVTIVANFKLLHCRYPSRIRVICTCRHPTIIRGSALLRLYSGTRSCLLAWAPYV